MAECEAGLDRLLQQSLVLVTVEIPHVGLLDGTHAKSFTGKYYAKRMLHHHLCGTNMPAIAVLQYLTRNSAGQQPLLAPPAVAA